MEYLERCKTTTASAGSHDRTHEGGRDPAEAAPAGGGRGESCLQRSRGALTEEEEVGDNGARRRATAGRHVRGHYRTG